MVELGGKNRLTPGSCASDSPAFHFEILDQRKEFFKCELNSTIQELQ
jgi:hypothetical protein